MLSRLIFSKSESGTLFIALTLGYLVFYFAKREEGLLKKLGYSIGVLVIAASLILLLGKLTLRLNACYWNNIVITTQ